MRAYSANTSLPCNTRPFFDSSWALNSNCYEAFSRFEKLYARIRYSECTSGEKFPGSTAQERRSFDLDACYRSSLECHSFLPPIQTDMTRHPILCLLFSLLSFVAFLGISPYILKDRVQRISGLNSNTGPAVVVLTLGDHINQPRFV